MTEQENATTNQGQDLQRDVVSETIIEGLPDPSRKTEQEEILETRETISRKILKGGSNEPIFIELRDDGSAVFKSKENEVALGRKVEKGTYYKREKAGYLVDRTIDFSLVPPTVIREVDGETGSAQEFIPDTNTIYNIKEADQEQYRDELIRLAMLDYIIFNSDRNKDNFLCKKGKIYAIDNGCTFENDYANFYCKPPMRINNVVPRDALEKLARFIGDETAQMNLRQALTGLISEREIQFCIQRAKLLLKTIIESNGEFNIAKINDLPYEGVE